MLTDNLKEEYVERAEKVISAIPGGRGYYERLYNAVAVSALLARAEEAARISDQLIHDPGVKLALQSYITELITAADELQGGL